VTGARSVRVESQVFDLPGPLALDSGARLNNVQLAYETYGELSEGRDNAILVFHALSGSQHAAGFNSEVPGVDLWTEESHLGWWDSFIGPGKALDTDRHFIVCANYLGSCYGSTGPSSIDPETGRPHASRFPDVTIADIVRSQIALLDHLAIERVLAVIGGSMGGMMSMEFALSYPDRTNLVIPIAAGAQVPELTKMHNFEQLLALQSDPNFNGGEYYDQPEKPLLGMTLARMIQHKTFVSLRVLRSRALGEIVQPEDILPAYRLRHRTESYMLHQGRKFANRFDANSYIKILTAWQTYNLPHDHGGNDLVRAFRRSAEAGHRYLLFSIDSDVCFYPEEQLEIVEALKACGVEHEYHTVHSDKGHDSFLIEPKLYEALLHHHLGKALEEAQRNSRRTGKVRSFMPEI
jgi:homoserine O-acetyltransferase